MARLRAYWLAPPGLAMLAATLLALAIRLYTLTRPGYLTGVTEYDDGVYLGGAIRLLQGSLPYHDFAFVQPPGILLLMAPVAVLGKISATTHAMAAARLLTVLASTACVPLAGSLVRYRGVLVTLVTCGLLAIYPDDIATAHTLILEPWLNLFCLLGVCIAFRRGRLASSRRLVWAGVAIGFAGTVKYWAALPAVLLLAVCLLTGNGWAGRVRRAGTYTLGVIAGFVVPVLPFFAFAPAAFVRSTLFDQATRASSYVPVSLRLAHLTGLIDVLNGGGHFSLTAGVHSLLADSGAAATSNASVGWLPYVGGAARGGRARDRLPVGAGAPVAAGMVRAGHRGRDGGGRPWLLGVLLPLPGLRRALARPLGRLRRRRAGQRIRRPAAGAAGPHRLLRGGGARRGGVPGERAARAARHERLPRPGADPGGILRGERRDLAGDRGQPVHRGAARLP